jgi:hypothetical protein
MGGETTRVSTVSSASARSGEGGADCAIQGWSAARAFPPFARLDIYDSTILQRSRPLKNARGGRAAPRSDARP